MSIFLKKQLPAVVNTPAGQRNARFVGYSRVYVAVRDGEFLPRSEPQEPINHRERAALEEQGYTVLEMGTPVLVFEDKSVGYGYMLDFTILNKDDKSNKDG
jgi:hypothetical protein